MEKMRSYTREPWFAVVLSSFWLGIGQIYSGRALRGSILLLTEIVLNCSIIWSVLSPRCDILVAAGLVLFLWAIRIWNLFDAHKCARKTNPEDFETERKQEKDPWLALFLSDLIPGLGQLYLKKWLWGIMFIIAAGLFLLIGFKYPLLRFGLWAILTTFVCYHAYISAPAWRERSNRTILIIAIAILCYHLLSYSSYPFRAYVVEPFAIPSNDFLPTELKVGSSMKPTLVPGDRVLVRKSKKYVPKRGDVVVFKQPDKSDNPFIKRVAALSGETIEIKDKMLYINGQKVQLPAIENIEYLPGKFGCEEPYKVPENSLFLLGDNTANSNDSRHFGAVPRSDLIGKAYKIYWPLSRRGPIE